ncbi:Methionyl-tRNA formyltransferase [Parachaetomium inaequale]|uniref:methionyl-tRNA formyltransferase n=1 Tax=Parachaetomium inaequale TaxID=2588326 RepID=A0AAN6SNB8_9PEZI|nr:Methionyl-tRNA formyltransferase [Parachaetomium inaequale]
MNVSRFAPSSLRTARAATPTRWRQPYRSFSKRSDPLRILFCGSDEFSVASLKALHNEHKKTGTGLIQSIDVVVRPSKPTGRGYKVLREVRLQAFAKELNLPIHVRDTFTGWDMPKPDDEPINLIIAVSFGLFVPPRLIHASKYGGLNVHPSMLPDLRGPAPIHHALLAERPFTGITIQTLSPENFDAGVHLAQTPPPGIAIPTGCTPDHLQQVLAPEGARMLVEALRAGLHVPPYEKEEEACQQRAPVATTTETPPLHAPKITTQDRQVLWTAQTARQVVVRQRVLGPLWTHLRLPGKDGVKEAEGSEKRAILDEISVVGGPPGREHASAGTSDRTTGTGTSSADGDVVWVQKTPVPQTKEEKKARAALRWETESVTSPYWVNVDGEAVIVPMGEESWLRIGRIKVEGSTFKPARTVLGGKGSK